MAGWQDSWVFVVALGGSVGKAEKRGLRLQSTSPPASSLQGNLQGPSGFEGRGQEETLNSGSTEDRDGEDFLALQHPSHLSQRLLLPSTLDQISTSICNYKLTTPHHAKRPPRVVREGDDQLVWRATPAGLGEMNAPPEWAEPIQVRPGGRETLECGGEKTEGCANRPRGGPER